MNEQGYNLNKNILYEDNQSAMRIAKNGVHSCGQNSRHYLIRYYFIKDRLTKDNIGIQYKATSRFIVQITMQCDNGDLTFICLD